MNTGSVDVKFLAAMIARHGSWSLFRVYPDLQSVMINECRGESIGIMRAVEGAAVAAVYAEANGTRWDAVAAFRAAL